MVGLTSELSEIIWKSSPQYLKAYQEGYEQARLEMLEKLKSMQALYDATTIMVTTERKA